ncbi:hypothetical protein F5888DRAFT_1664214 [Russula emetica]|nr:hypothetical protein F5888DRAFT_1664214 [Russula emetica]
MLVCLQIMYLATAMNWPRLVHTCLSFSITLQTHRERPITYSCMQNCCVLRMLTPQHCLFPHMPAPPLARLQIRGISTERVPGRC